LGQVVPGLGEGLRLLVEDGVAARAVPLPADDVVGLLRSVALLAPLLVLGGVDEEDHVPLGFRVRHRGKVRGLGFRSTKRGIGLCNTIAPIQTRTRRAGSLPPEVLEPGRRKLGVFGGVLDPPVAHVHLDRPGVVAVVAQLVAAAVPEHVRMHGEGEAGRLAQAGQHLEEAGRRDRRPPFAEEDERGVERLAAELAQGAQLVAPDRMRRGEALLAAADMEQGLRKLHLVPLQGAQLGRPQAVAVGGEDHGGVPMAVAVAGLGRLHEVGHLGGRQEFPRPVLGVRAAAGNCPKNRGWGVGHREALHG
jgi:hypothetical protein